MNDNEAVEYFQYMRRMIEAFKKENEAVLQQYAALCEEYNTAREAAERFVRETGTPCEGFQILSKSNRYDAELLYESIGPEEFLKVGTLEMVQRLSVSRDRFEAAVAAGRIDPKIVQRVKSTQVRLHAPKKAELP